MSSATGTANQVLVNGTSGSAQTGAITLTLPQDIATTSGPRFARIGLGTAADSLFRLKIIHDEAVTECVSVQGNLNAPALTDLHAHAYRDSTQFTSSVAADAYSSVDAVAQIKGTLAYNHFFGFQARHIHNGSGLLDVMAGAVYYPTHVSGSSTTLSAGLLVYDSIGTGTIATNCGVYVNTLTRGTLNYGIYTDGTTPSYFGGNVGIGAAPDTRRVLISGSAAAVNIAHIVATAATYSNTVLKIGTVDAAPSGNLFILATGVNTDGTGGSATPMVINGAGNLSITGSIFTASPSGGTQQTWKLGNYTAGLAVQAGKVRVEINGVAYDLLTA